MTTPYFLKRLVLLFSVLMAPAAWSDSTLPPPPQLAAKSWVLMDVASGSVLVDHQGVTRLPPASLTKLMTAHVAALELQRGRIKESDLVTISEKAWRMGGSKMFVQVGDQIAVSDLLRGIIVQSGNDASIALAEHLAGGEDTFAALMNQEAKRLGLADTHFLNATGWPAEGHYSSALDMAKLARAIIIEDPEHYAMYAEKEFVWSGIKQPNRNLLLWRDPTVDGLKTGHTEEAGYCMVASSKRDGVRLVASVFGTVSENARATETAKLLAYGFNFFDSKTFFKQGETLQTVAVWKGAARTVKAGVATDFAAALPKRTSGEYLTRIVLAADAPVAPIAAGAPLGQVELVSADGKVVMQAPLVALETVEEGGFFRRVWDGIRLFFKGLFG
jgi:D-alanyl-D-alanine carboxypeptidase (penicillin-binding protein 5/6)